MSALRPDQAAQKQHCIDNLDRFRGVEALYREGIHVSRVRVVDLVADDKGITVQVALLSTPGLFNERPLSWSVYSAWEAFGYSTEQWVAPYISLTIYFERGLIEAVVRNCENAPSAFYDSDRFAQIGTWIQKYRRKKLEHQLSSELQLFWNGRLIGTITGHLLGEFPEIHGQFTPADMEAGLKTDLSWYGTRRFEGWKEDGSDNSLERRLAGDWSLQTVAGLRIQTCLPAIDFRRHAILWRYLGLRETSF